MSVINQVLKDLGARQSRSELRFADMVKRQTAALQLPGNRSVFLWPALMFFSGALLAGILLLQRPTGSITGTVPVAAPATDARAAAASAPAKNREQAPAVAPVAVAVESKPGQPVRPAESVPQIKPASASASRIKAEPQTTKAETPAAAQGTEKLEITRRATPANQAANYYRQGLEKLQADRIEAAISDLRKAVGLQADMHTARELLAALLLRRGYSAEAYAELQRGMELEPGHTAYARLYAQSLVETGQPDEALRILSISAPYAAQQPDYLAFMAAVAQRLARHEDSVRHYMAALELKPARSAWWIGMAISLEALGRSQDAVQAYRTALAGNELNPDLMNYARERATQLDKTAGG
jgi:MSHA biogenesis protein MshN